MPQWMAPHPWTDGKFQLDSVDYQVHKPKKGGCEVRREMCWKARGRKWRGAMTQIHCIQYMKD